MAEGKWLEHGFTIALWVAAVAFVWFVMDVPGLWGRLMEYARPQSAPLAALCSLLFIFLGLLFLSVFPCFCPWALGALLRNVLPCRARGHVLRCKRSAFGR